MHDKKPLGDRRTIRAATKKPQASISTFGTYLILIPTYNDDWSDYKTSFEYFPVEELRYIDTILLQIRIEESNEYRKILDELPPVPVSNNNDDDDIDKDDKSSLGSSLSYMRAIEWTENYSDKNFFIQKWINDGK